MKTIGHRHIGNAWFVAEVGRGPDARGLYHWHVKKLPVRGGQVIFGNLIVFGVEESLEAAQRKALEALEEEARVAVD